MKEDYFTFTYAKDDLLPWDENWRSCSLKEAKEKVFSDTKKRYGYHPRANAKFFRKIAFLIKGNITLDALRAMGIEMKRRWGIECIQISIRRDINEADMMFCWYNESTGCSKYMSSKDMKNIIVFILRYLHLPRPMLADTWLRYFLIQEYDDNHDVFRKAIDLVSRKDIDGKSYDVIHDALSYAEMMSRGIVK